jgi:hypothetical protein
MDIISDKPAFKTVAEFLAACRQWEKRGKRWGQYVGTIAGKPAAIKTYGRSYPQIVRVGEPAVDYGGHCDMKPAQFAALMQRAFG